MTTMEDVFLKVSSEQKAAVADPNIIGAHRLSSEAPAQHIAFHPQVQAGSFPNQSHVVVDSDTGIGDYSAASTSNLAFGSNLKASWTCFGFADNLVRMQVRNELRSQSKHFYVSIAFMLSLCTPMHTAMIYYIVSSRADAAPIGRVGIQECVTLSKRHEGTNIFGEFLRLLLQFLPLY